jgi:hypothetical protein
MSEVQPIGNRTTKIFSLPAAQAKQLHLFRVHMEYLIHSIQESPYILFLFIKSILGL